MAVLYLLHDPHRLALPLVVSKLASAQVAIFNNFLWNDLWTFRDRSSLHPGAAARFARFARFEVICLAGMAIAVGVLALCVRRFGMHYQLGNLIAIGVGTAWNFLVNLKWNWAASPERAA
jgi:dolichol-phosphate mannosyltransferase